MSTYKPALKDGTLVKYSWMMIIWYKTNIYQHTALISLAVCANSCTEPVAKTIYSSWKSWRISILSNYSDFKVEMACWNYTTRVNEYPVN